jgi:transcription-repair coupling factor (superfamily II helicase)
VANIKFHRETKVDPEKLMRLVGKIGGAQFTPAGVLRLPLDGLEGAAEILGRLRERFEELVV